MGIDLTRPTLHAGHLENIWALNLSDDAHQKQALHIKKWIICLEYIFLSLTLFSVAS
jgi:hypothetical protein